VWFVINNLFILDMFRPVGHLQKDTFLPTWLETTSQYYHVHVEPICEALFEVHRYLKLNIFWLLESIQFNKTFQWQISWKSIQRFMRCHVLYNRLTNTVKLYLGAFTFQVFATNALDIYTPTTSWYLSHFFSDKSYTAFTFCLFLSHTQALSLFLCSCGFMTKHF
jgi:hypothetical protein